MATLVKMAAPSLAMLEGLCGAEVLFKLLTAPSLPFIALAPLWAWCAQGNCLSLVWALKLILVVLFGTGVPLTAFNIHEHLVIPFGKL